MVGFGRRRHEQDQRAADEDPVVRQYRYLLRQAPPDAVEAAHTEALPCLGDAERRAVLSAVQGGLVAGQRLQPEDTRQIAHLIVMGERRAPNAFLSACEPGALLALSQAVIDSDACFGLFGQYASWDGADPDAMDTDEAPAADDLHRSGWNSAASPGKDGAGGYPGGFPGGRLPDSTGGHRTSPPGY
jgi:hypothetical protein